MPFRPRTDRSPLRTLSPRQNQIGWIDSLPHVGVTTMISADKVHMPGRPRRRRPKSDGDFRVASVLDTSSRRRKGPTWRPVIETEIVEQTFKELAAAGVKLLGEVGLAASRMARSRATQFAEQRRKDFALLRIERRKRLLGDRQRIGRDLLGHLLTGARQADQQTAAVFGIGTGFGDTGRSADRLRL
jgi:hypothetical protein